eukprot:NODE_4537_length_1050_cov_91.033441_g4335_i0.p1 GENE.NODE_4537_length_1050_cov_91.033441_g4335_i0~~NODE_4537_length_1050_cov_91.033441_g4335_i0.p1  ORF type:complete len:158 (-),score=18.12 NODE_4537_length_1050_cov_91.033441_g4335_i0:106-579(-)
MWDLRSGKCSNTLAAFEGQQLTADKAANFRSKQWVSCMDVDASNNWLIVGGGCQYLTLWHLPSSTLSAVLPTASTAQCALFDDHQIVTAGSEPFVTFWSKNGKVTGRLPVACPSVYSIASNGQTGQKKALCLAGLGPQLDVFGDWNRKLGLVSRLHH